MSALDYVIDPEVGVWLGNVNVIVRVVDGWPTGFWGMWCPDVVGVGAVVVERIGYAKVMVVGGEGYCYEVEGWLMMRNVVVRWWRRWVGVRWMMHMIKRRFLRLFLLA
jgi:hypothetical protein